MVLSDVKRIQRRAKQAERDVGKWMLEYDGEDIYWSRISSSTGRVGHITGLMFDIISRTYCTEVKNVMIPVRLQRAWAQIQELATKHGKEACLVIQPSNPIATIGRPKQVDLTWHIITAKRHAELLEIERVHNG